MRRGAEGAIRGVADVLPVVEPRREGRDQRARRQRPRPQGRRGDRSDDHAERHQVGAELVQQIAVRRPAEQLRAADEIDHERARQGHRGGPARAPPKAQRRQRPDERQRQQRPQVFTEQQRGEAVDGPRVLRDEVELVVHRRALHPADEQRDRDRDKGGAHEQHRGSRYEQLRRDPPPPRRDQPRERDADQQVPGRVHRRADAAGDAGDRRRGQARATNQADDAPQRRSGEGQEQAVQLRHRGEPHRGRQQAEGRGREERAGPVGAAPTRRQRDDADGDSRAQPVGQPQALEQGAVSVEHLRQGVRERQRQRVTRIDEVAVPQPREHPVEVVFVAQLGAQRRVAQRRQQAGAARQREVDDNRRSHRCGRSGLDSFHRQRR